MSFFRSNKFITFICLMASALLLTFGIIAFLPTAEMSSATSSSIAAVSVNFDMFKSFAALKTWLGAIPYYIYLSVALALFLIAALCIVVAVCKKARQRRNDVNVLILVGDEDEKVDATVFKEHYAVVVVAKPSSLSPVKPRVLPQIVPLENNRRYIPIPNENPRQNIEKEDIVVIENVAEVAVAQPKPVVQEPAPIAKEPIKQEPAPVVKEPIKQEPAPKVKEPIKQEPAPVAKEPIKQEPAPKVKEPIKQEQPPIVVVQPQEEEPIVFEPYIEQEPLHIQENKEVIAKAPQNVNMDEVFEQAYSDVNTSQLEEEELYDESEFNSESFEEVKFDQNEFNVSPIIINNLPEIIEDDEPEIILPTEEENFECITVQEEVKPIIKEKVRKTESVYDVQEFEPITFEQDYRSNATEIAFEEEAAIQNVPLADIATQTSQNKTNTIIPTSIKTNIEDSAYAIIKEKHATEDAIAATQNGDIIVDADGDDIVDEVLEDKDILKMRYKTIELDKRLKRTEEDVKGYYSDLKNALLSYKGVKSRLSKKFDTFTLGRFIVAKLALRGNVINLYLALPNEQVDDKYFAEDVSDSDTYGKTPTLHKVKSKRGCKYGIELIEELMNAIAVSKSNDFESVDYVAMYPADNIDDQKKEIKRLMTDRAFVEDVDVLSDEEAFEFIQIVKNKAHTINKFNPINKFVAFVDDIAELYEPNEIVTIDNLIAKGALPDMDNLFLEIRAKGYLDKTLTFEAHSFDIKAVKMITLLNGNVIQYK